MRARLLTRAWPRASGVATGAGRAPIVARRPGWGRAQSAGRLLDRRLHSAYWAPPSQGAIFRRARALARKSGASRGGALGRWAPLAAGLALAWRAPFLASRALAPFAHQLRPAPSLSGARANPHLIGARPNGRPHTEPSAWRPAFSPFAPPPPFAGAHVFSRCQNCNMLLARQRACAHWSKLASQLAKWLDSSRIRSRAARRCARSARELLGARSQVANGHMRHHHGETARATGVVRVVYFVLLASGAGATLARHRERRKLVMSSLPDVKNNLTLGFSASFPLLAGAGINTHARAGAQL